MADPTLPQDFTRTFKEIFKRLANLEGRGVGNNLSIHTNAEQHGINIINEDDVEEVRLGVLQAGNTNPILDFQSDGLAVFNSDAGNIPAVWYDYDKGTIYPHLPYSWQVSNTFVIVTSATFVPVYDTTVYSLPSTWLQFQIILTVAPTTTADIRVTMNGIQLGSIKALTTGQTNLWFKVAHGVTVTTGPQNFVIEVRRTSGAGDINVFQPKPLAFGTPHTLPVGGWETF